MAVTNRLVFDPGEIANAADGGSNVGAYVRAGTDGDLIDSKTIGGTEWLQVASALHAGDGTAITQTGGALDVNVSGVDFTYDYAEDAAHSSGDVGAYVLAVRQDTLASSTSADGDYASFKVDAAGALYINGSNYTQPVSATNLDIRDLAFATDKVDVSGSSVSISGSVTVTATDFDIRDLVAATDSVSAWTKDGSGNSIGSINSHLLVADVANTAIENTATAVSTSAVNVVSSALANRIYLALANEGNKMLYFGKTGVTTANGFPLPPGGQQMWRIGAAVAPQIIGEFGSSSEDLRVMELS